MERDKFIQTIYGETNATVKENTDNNPEFGIVGNI